MANPPVEIAIGQDPLNGATGFTLDSATLGVLDSSYLMGALFVTVNDYAMSFSFSNGKSRELDQFQSGSVSVTFDNTKRYFDPTYTSSPFYGLIVPRLFFRIRVNLQQVFYGVIDDWNLDYSTNGEATATVTAYDQLSWLSQQTLSADTYPVEYPGTRINRILSSSSVNFPTYSRRISDGQFLLGSETVDASMGVLDYLNSIARTEAGDFFINGPGEAVFHDATWQPTSQGIKVFSDNGIGFAYQGMKIVYGTELLYNQAIVTRKGGTAQTANNSTSQTTYGVRVITEDTLHNADADASRLASWFVNMYSSPEFRFESIEISLGDATTAEQNQILDVAIGDLVQVIFTPSNVPPAITRYAKVIGISHNADPNQHIVSFKLATLDRALMVLNDAVFGLLDSYYLGI